MRTAIVLVTALTLLLGCGSGNGNSPILPMPGQNQPAPAPGSSLQSLMGNWHVTLTTASGAPSLEFTTTLSPEPGTDQDDFVGSNLMFVRSSPCFTANARVDGHFSDEFTRMVLRLRSPEGSENDNRLEINAQLSGDRRSARGTYVIEAKGPGCAAESGTAVLIKM